MLLRKEQQTNFKEPTMRIIELIRNESGQGLVEYSLIISLVIVAVISALKLFGKGVLDYYIYIDSEFPK